MATIICKTFPDSLHTRLRVLAAYRGTSVQDTIKYALEKFVDEQEKSEWYQNIIAEKLHKK